MSMHTASLGLPIRQDVPTDQPNFVRCEGNRDEPRWLAQSTRSGSSYSESNFFKSMCPWAAGLHGHTFSEDTRPFIRSQSPKSSGNYHINASSSKLPLESTSKYVCNSHIPLSNGRRRMGLTAVHSDSPKNPTEPPSSLIIPEPSSHSFESSCETKHSKILCANEIATSAKAASPSGYVSMYSYSIRERQRNSTHPGSKEGSPKTATALLVTAPFFTTPTPDSLKPVTESNKDIREPLYQAR